MKLGLRHPNPALTRATRRHPRITTTFSTVTWGDSGSSDDYEEEHGWIDEEGVSMTPDRFDREEGLTVVDKAVRFLKDEGAIEASSTVFHKGIWYTSESQQDMHTGAHEQRSYHLDGFTEEEERAIYAEMVPRWRRWNPLSSIEVGALALGTAMLAAGVFFFARSKSAAAAPPPQPGTPTPTGLPSPAVTLTENDFAQNRSIPNLLQGAVVLFNVPDNVTVSFPSPGQMTEVGSTSAAGRSLVAFRFQAGPAMGFAYQNGLSLGSVTLTA